MEEKRIETKMIRFLISESDLYLFLKEFRETLCFGWVPFSIGIESTSSHKYDYGYKVNVSKSPYGGSDVSLKPDRGTDYSSTYGVELFRFDVSEEMFELESQYFELLEKEKNYKKEYNQIEQRSIEAAESFAKEYAEESKQRLAKIDIILEKAKTIARARCPRIDELLNMNDRELIALLTGGHDIGVDKVLPFEVYWEETQKEALFREQHKRTSNINMEYMPIVTFVLMLFVTPVVWLVSLGFKGATIEDAFRNAGICAAIFIFAAILFAVAGREKYYKRENPLPNANVDYESLLGPIVDAKGIFKEIAHSMKGYFFKVGIVNLDNQICTWLKESHYLR